MVEIIGPVKTDEKVERSVEKLPCQPSPSPRCYYCTGEIKKGEKGALVILRDGITEGAIVRLCAECRKSIKILEK